MEPLLLDPVGHPTKGLASPTNLTLGCSRNGRRTGGTRQVFGIDKGRYYAVHVKSYCYGRSCEESFTSHQLTAILDRTLVTVQVLVRNLNF
jgi:hypothetical protein